MSLTVGIASDVCSDVHYGCAVMAVVNVKDGKRLADQLLRP
jgi:hypothetical protein